LVTYLGVATAVIAIVAIAYTPALIASFWLLVIVLLGGAGIVILVHQYEIANQICERRDVIRSVANELRETLECSGGDEDLSELKSSLHSSCKPYFNAAILLLKKESILD
jgi:hypothetical protein